jgi:hypothetical protein
VRAFAVKPTPFAREIPMFGMKRRDFITLLGSAAAAWPLAAPAQQAGRMRRVGVLMFGAADDREATAIIAAFMQGLKAIGLGFRPKGQNQCSPRWEQRDNSESDTWQAARLRRTFRRSPLRVGRRRGQRQYGLANLQALRPYHV